MKLIDLLVKELPNRGGWPCGVDAVEQDSEGQLFEMESDYCSDFKLEKCDDWIADVVTKQQYEAALAASKAVVGHNSWIQWAGGDCPVDSDAIVEVKFRWHNQCQYNNDRAGDFDWAHTGSSADIIAYRVHKPDAKSRANDDRMENDLNECIGQDFDIPEWNGGGLPPVGTVCMANLANGWTDVKVAYIGDEGGCREALVFEIKTTKPAWADEFRPLRTEAEKLRDEAGLALYHAINWNAEGEMVSPSRMEDYKKAYDAIAAGKIPGVKLEGK